MLKFIPQSSSHLHCKLAAPAGLRALASTRSACAATRPAAANMTPPARGVMPLLPPRRSSPRLDVQCNMFGRRGSSSGGGGGGDRRPNLRDTSEQLRTSMTGMLRNDDLESHRVDPALRGRVLDAVENLGHKGTVGDVAARAGTTLGETERALQALAADTHGTLQVSDLGEVLYVFPGNARSQLAAKSLWVRLEPAAAGAQRLAGFVVRAAFGLTLLASVAVVWTTLAVLMSSGSGDRDRGGGGGGRIPMYFDFTDVVYFWDPWYYRRRASYYGHDDGGKQRRDMGLLESIFSFVFGDGDPNEGLEERRWQLVGQFIQSQGGVVAAEQLAPFLDPPPRAAAARESPLDREAYMMPVLLRFGGHPRVDDGGHVLYEFPTLQSTGRAGRPSPPAERAVQERPWALSRADALGKAAAVALGVFNAVGIATLVAKLREPAIAALVGASSLRWVGAALPFLSAYALAFFAVPLARVALNAARNRGIAARNEARVDALAELASPGPGLRAKLSSAAALASTSTVGGANILYRTDSGLDEQPRSWEMEEFDRRMSRGSSSSGAGGAGPSAAAPLPAAAAAKSEAAPGWFGSSKNGGSGGAAGRGEAAAEPDWRDQIFQQQSKQQQQQQQSRGGGEWWREP